VARYVCCYGVIIILLAGFRCNGKTRDMQETILSATLEFDLQVIDKEANAVIAGAQLTVMHFNGEDYKCGGPWEQVATTTVEGNASWEYQLAYSIQGEAGKKLELACDVIGFILVEVHAHGYYRGRQIPAISVEEKAHKDLHMSLKPISLD